MNRLRFFTPLTMVTVFAALFGSSEGSAQVPGVSREAMWPAPTAEDWRKPCLITWQRTYEDAQAVSRETGKPILICVNMDGEIASEHYAGIRYRRPETASLYDPYVTVIASVYRHTPRDYDEEGRRILCPRFGSVTCGEHIAIEPGLHDQYFEGQRIAPRHIGVELDGGEMYDVFYAFDTDSVFDTLRDGIANRQAPPAVQHGDRSMIDRVASRDVLDRQAVEEAYREGDREVRQSLLDAAVQNIDEAPIDLLRQAIFGLDVDLSKKARLGLAASSSSAATGLIADALGVPMSAAERGDLIGALQRIGEDSPKARTLAVVHRGLSSAEGSVDVQHWSEALAAADPAAGLIDAYELDTRLQEQNNILRTADAAQHVALAEAFLDRAFNSTVDPEFAQLLYMDAQNTARKAEELGATGWRVAAVHALAAYYLKDSELAHRQAEVAVDALPAGATEYNAMAVLELFAKLRCQAIAKAVEAKEDWPPEWLTDVNAACSVLAGHPNGTAAQIAWHYDILQWLKASGQASRVLDQGLFRFPDSADLHQRLRGRILREKGVRGLESAYAALLERPEASPDLRWFAGFAALQAAEFHRRRGRTENAWRAYDRGMDYYEQAAVELADEQDSAGHFIALALGGQARIALENREFENSVQKILASFERRADSAATLDGLNISSVDTAKMLLAALQQEGHSELAAQVQAGLDGLDPELLRLPAYEAVGPPAQPPAGQ
jgi:hypothetical protein